MKINDCITRLAVRWRAPSAQHLHELVDQLWANRDTPRWSSCRFDPQNTGDEPDISIHFHPTRLDSMRHFRVCHTNEGIWQIAAGAEGKHDRELLNATVERFRRLDLKRTRLALLEWTSEGSYFDHPEAVGRVRLDVGWRSILEPPGYYVSVFCSNPRASVATRHSFIMSTLLQMGLEDIVKVVGDEMAFVLKARDGWSLYELEDPHTNRNPHFCPIGPFSSFDDVWPLAERFLAAPRDLQIDRLALGFAMAPDIYETMYGQLNELANEWEVRTYGSYAEEIDPYTAEAARSPDGRFPVLVWSPARELNGPYYQADIVPTPGGRFLEIHSNCGNLKKLLREAEAASGVSFGPVRSEYSAGQENN